MVRSAANLPIRTTPSHTGRRAILSAIALCPFVRSAKSAQIDSNDGDNPLIQELLRRTEEKREERRRERLEDYYRRNFSDYFSFEMSPGMRSQGLSSETIERIKEWQEKSASAVKRASQ